MKKLITIFCFAFGFSSILWLATGCRNQQPVVVIEYQERIVERVVPIELPADSSELRLLLECDSLNNVLISEVSELKTKRITSEFTLSSNQLVYKTKTIRDTVFVPVVDTFQQYIEIQKPAKAQKDEIKKLSKLQNLVIWIGRFYLLSIIAGFVVFLIITYRKIKKF